MLDNSKLPFKSWQSAVSIKFSKVHSPMMEGGKVCWDILLFSIHLSADTTGRNDWPEAYMTGIKNTLILGDSLTDPLNLIC